MTDWNENKTEAIDFSMEFIWLDDFIFTKDREILEENGVTNNLIEVNLKDNQYQLLEIINIF
jgi:hypothetical protein